MQVFYSWQSDSPNQTNRGFIRKALDKAIQELNTEVDVSEADRQTVTLDHDTKGIMGAPPIAQTILEKIVAADVIVCDVSLVADGNDNKKHINSNVAIELGYALGKKGDHALLNIMNTASGSPDDLPFDLRDRRHPIQYHLDENATHEQRASELTKLVGKLHTILKEYLNSVPTSSETRQSHRKMPHVWTLGHFWAEGESLIDENDTQLFCNFRRIFYFRAIPTFEQSDLTSKATLDAIANFPSLVGEASTHRRNKWGALSVAAWWEDNIILSGCQIMTNREIWAFDALFANQNYFWKLRGMDAQNPELLPSQAIAEKHHIGIGQILAVVRKLGYADSYTIEYGLTDSKGLHLATREPDPFEGYPGPIHTDNVMVQIDCNKDTSPDAIRDQFIQKLFEEAGHDAPQDCLTDPKQL